MNPDRSKPGFTLVELITAVTLTVMLAGSTVVILRNSAAASRRADTQLALQQRARTALLAVAGTLANADRLSSLQGLDDWLDHVLGTMPCDRISFFAVSRKTIRQDQPESDIKEYEFFLDLPPERYLPVLMRRTDPTRNQTPDGGGVVELIAEDILGLNLRYHDGIKWRDDWPKGTKGWPLAVRVELAVPSQTDPLKVWTTSRVVTFPYPTVQKGSPEE